MAKKYDEVAVEKWNVRHFHDFMSDYHKKKLGVTYQPGGGWRAEQGLLGDIIGTQKKKAQYDKELIKEFIIRCVDTYSPRQGFPGISFMFMWSFRKNVLQQLELDFARKQAAEVASTADDLDEEWF